MTLGREGRVGWLDRGEGESMKVTQVKSVIMPVQSEMVVRKLMVLTGLVLV